MAGDGTLSLDRGSPPMKSGVTTEQKLALALEVRTAIKLLRVGLGELQSIDGANDFYYLPFQLLSSGFERLMKCMICLKRQHDTGQFPATEELKTHDLLALKDRVVSECISRDTAYRRPATKDDYAYMVGDDELKRLLGMLSQFGKFARYYNLDVVTGSTKPTVDVEEKWCQYETELLNDDKKLSALSKDSTRLDELYRYLNRIIVSRLERFARALVRQFTLGDLGKEAKTYTRSISCFLCITDSELGNVDYGNISGCTSRGGPNG